MLPLVAFVTLSIASLAQAQQSDSAEAAPATAEFSSETPQSGPAQSLQPTARTASDEEGTQKKAASETKKAR
jgi:hypothetical protein